MRGLPTIIFAGRLEEWPDCVALSPEMFYFFHNLFYFLLAVILIMKAICRRYRWRGRGEGE